MFKKRKMEIGIPSALALALAVSIIITLAGAAIVAWLIAGGKAGEGIRTVAVHGLQLLSAGLGAWVAITCVQKMRLQVGLLSGLVYYLSLLGITALFYNGEYERLGISALMVLIGCGMMVILPISKKGRGIKRSRRVR